MTAIDEAFCNANARSCGVVQDMLERSPGLAFVNGQFVHAKTLVPPSPPPAPDPPPRTFAYAPHPPSPPPPPVTPPPYYRARAATPTRARRALARRVPRSPLRRTPSSASRCRASPTTAST
jgi:phage tail protein X